MKQISLLLENVGPHAKTELRFSAGANILRARNGAGKSTAIEAITAALSTGKEGSATVRDGHLKGHVYVDGVMVLAIGKRLTANGQPSIELGGFSPIGDLIDPGIVDPVKADARRIKAVLAMAPIPVDDQVRDALAQGDDELRRLRPPDGAEQNVLAVADHIRREAHRLALDAEKQEAVSRSVADAKSAELANSPASGMAIPLADAEEAHREAQRALTRTQLLAGQRAEAEERNKRIEATLGERPSTDLAQADYDATVKAYEDAQREVEELEKKLTAARGRFEGAKFTRVAAERNLSSTKQAQGRWDASKAELDKPITGPTIDDVHRAEENAKAALDALERAKVHAKVKTLQDEIGQALSVGEVSRTRAHKLRELAHGVSDALGVVLGKHGIAKLDVEESRLFATVDGKRQLFGERLSFGQRVRIALDIALTVYQGRCIPLLPQFWAALQPKNQKELAAIAVERDVVLVSEAPSDDDVITVEHIP